MTGRDTGGYQLPGEINPPGEVCLVLKIPNDPAYIRAAFGQLFELARWSAWERDDQKQGTLAAQRWRQSYDWMIKCFEENGMGDCDFCCEEELVKLDDILAAIQALADLPGQMTTINNTTITNTTLATYQYYLDNPGELPQDVPDTTYTSDSGDPPGGLPTRQVALCHAIDSYLDTILLVHDKVFDVAETLLEVTAAGAVAAGAAIPAVLVALAGIFLDAYTDALFEDQEARQKLRCCMYDSLKEADPRDWPAFRDSLLDCGFEPPTHESTLAGFVNATNHIRPNHIIFLTFLGATWPLAELQLLEGADRCTCDEVPGTCWDFAGGSFQGWEGAEGSPFEMFPDNPEHVQIFSDLVGGVNSFACGAWGPSSRCSMYVALPVATEVNHFAFQVWFAGLSVGRPYWLKFWDVGLQLLWQRTGTFAGGEGWYQLEEDTPVLSNVGFISIHFDWSWRTAVDLLRINSGGIVACS